MSAQNASHAWVKPLLRAVLSLSALGLTAWFVDLSEVLAALGQLNPLWLLASLALQGLQVVILAVRWHWVNRQLNIPLPLSTALYEYTLSTSLNLLLPGGFAGDVARGYRQSRRAEETAQLEVWLGVVVDRGLGQLGVWSLAALSVWWWLPQHASPSLALIGMAIIAGVVVASSWWLARRHRRLGAGLLTLQRQLLRPRGVVLHTALSSALLTAWVASFYCASRALAFETPALEVSRAAIPALLGASIPGFVNGWGAREGAAALAYGWAGLSRAEGSTVSLTYGMVGVVLALLGLTLSFVGKRRH